MACVHKQGGNPLPTSVALQLQEVRVSFGSPTDRLRAPPWGVFWVFKSSLAQMSSAGYHTAACLLANGFQQSSGVGDVNVLHIIWAFSNSIWNHFTFNDWLYHFKTTQMLDTSYDQSLEQAVHQHHRDHQTKNKSLAEVGHGLTRLSSTGITKPQ